MGAKAESISVDWGGCGNKFPSALDFLKSLCGGFFVWLEILAVLDGECFPFCYPCESRNDGDG